MANERIFRIQSIAGLRGMFSSAYAVAKRLMEEGKEIEIILRERKSKRSIDQNRRYWAILREVAAVVWVNGRQYSDEVWHEHFRRTFIGKNEITLPDGSTELRGISTTTLNVGEFTEYMDRIEQWCAEQGYIVGDI